MNVNNQNFYIDNLYHSEDIKDTANIKENTNKVNLDSNLNECHENEGYESDDSNDSFAEELKSDNNKFGKYSLKEQSPFFGDVIYTKIEPCDTKIEPYEYYFSDRVENMMSLLPDKMKLDEDESIFLKNLVENLNFFDWLDLTEKKTTLLEFLISHPGNCPLSRPCCINAFTGIHAKRSECLPALRMF